MGEVCSAVGINHRSIHKLRKTNASRLFDMINLNTIRNQMGHKGEKTTMQSYIYDTNTKDEVRAMIDEALRI